MAVALRPFNMKVKSAVISRIGLFLRVLLEVLLNDNV